MVTQIKDKDDLQSKINDAGDKLVLVEFYATWCKPCKAVGPKLDELAKKFPNVCIHKVDVEECEDLAMEYEISMMPTFVFIINKNVVLSFAGADMDRLTQAIVEHQ